MSFLSRCFFGCLLPCLRSCSARRTSFDRLLGLYIILGGNETTTRCFCRRVKDFNCIGNSISITIKTKIQFDLIQSGGKQLVFISFFLGRYSCRNAFMQEIVTFNGFAKTNLHLGLRFHNLLHKQRGARYT